jgi:phosphoglycolate phosphatase
LVGIACGAVTWGYAAPKALIDRKPDFVFTGMDEIAAMVLRDVPRL